MVGIRFELDWTGLVRKRLDWTSIGSNSNCDSLILESELKENSAVFRGNEAVHAFYYPWYANEEVDGKWAHWNHPILPHWIARVNAQYPIGKIHQPADDIAIKEF